MLQTACKIIVPLSCCSVSSRCRCSRWRSLSSLFLLPPTSVLLTTRNMAASSDRNPPPFPATEEPGEGLSDMADGDSDEGEDIFVSNVCPSLTLANYNLFVAVLSAWSERASKSASLSDLTCIHGIQNNWEPLTGRREMLSDFGVKATKLIRKLNRGCFSARILYFDSVKVC